MEALNGAGLVKLGRAWAKLGSDSRSQDKVEEGARSVIVAYTNSRFLPQDLISTG